METITRVDTLKQKYQKLIESQNIQLLYADYRDKIEDAELLQKIATNEFDYFDECNLWDTENESINLWIAENIEEGDDRDFFDSNEELQEFIGDTLRDNDKSDYIAQVIRNSSDFIAYYDLEIEGCGDYSSEEDIKNTIEAIQEKTGADRKTIAEICNNAFYGGNIQLMFSMSPDAYIKAKNSNAEEIQFKGTFVLACADYFNGSGHSEKVNIDITLKYKAGNLYLDALHKYNFADCICGLMHSYFENDNIKLL